MNSAERRVRLMVGDQVRVDFNNSQFTLTSRATVAAMPCATGDSWVFIEGPNGKLFYVSEGCTITKLEGDSQ